jgi:hypothetical protein
VTGTAAILWAVGASGVLLIAAFTVIFLRLASRFDAQAVSPAWLDEFSLENYAPMERLLDSSDFQFLAAQPGHRPEITKVLLAERRKIFGEYLHLLIGDFNQLHFLAKLMLVHSAEDRPELARELFRQQLRFYAAVSFVRCKVALYPLGWTAVDVPKLLHSLQQMRNQLSADGLPAGAAI